MPEKAQEKPRVKIRLHLKMFFRKCSTESSLENLWEYTKATPNQVDDNFFYQFFVFFYCFLLIIQNIQNWYVL
uniref:Uncharacterized protein n=1 Tax=Meloidogyne enterolobii TaxID=390850 RepID=A0A6V7WK28_MELEN|nr:unnamed protein product [Meloidogyne enterolobii]